MAVDALSLMPRRATALASPLPHTLDRDSTMVDSMEVAIMGATLSTRRHSPRHSPSTRSLWEVLETAALVTASPSLSSIAVIPATVLGTLNPVMMMLMIALCQLSVCARKFYSSLAVSVFGGLWSAIHPSSSPWYRTFRFSPPPLSCPCPVFVHSC